MRRSNAPSMLNKAKLYYNSCGREEESSDPEDEQYAWGSRNNRESKRCRYENKRTFNVVWRDVSTKKHKTWKGDGTLEVNNVLVKAILKDETGKYMGCSTSFNECDLVPEFHMIIGRKEIEIQNEIIDEDQLEDLRRRQIENCGEEEWISMKGKVEEEKKPKGGFKFKPILVLNPPKVNSNIQINLEKGSQGINCSYIPDKVQKPQLHSETSVSKNERNPCLSKLTVNLQTSSNAKLCEEYICFLRPSELQQFLFRKVLEYCSSIISALTSDKIKSLNIDNVLKDICNHPSLINHKTTTNKLIRYLIPVLPDWTEMGPFDSSKLEFVQCFLKDLSRHYSQNCIIFAKGLNVLNMLEGLCNFMTIKCLRLNSNHFADIDTQAIIKFCLSGGSSSQVLLINSLEMLNSFDFFTYCKQLIIFEEVSKNMNISCGLENDVTIYKLVTAFSIEELLLLDTYNNLNIEMLLDDLVKITDAETDCCYLHSKIECNCFKNNHGTINSNNLFIKNWKHFKNPFDMPLLKISSMESSLENVVSIFYKKIN